MMEISVIIPMFNEEENVNILYDKLFRVMNGIGESYELIFVDDGSTDHTLQKIENLHSKYQTVKVISFKKNFGKAAALDAGFGKAEGKIVITMDGDLQDEPAEIPKFIKKISEGYDLVNGWKTTKHKGTPRVIPSKIFNWMASAITGIKIHDFNCPFKAYRKEVIKDINLYGEMHRYIPALAYWKGYKTTEIKVTNYPRKHGKSKYGTKRILKGFLDLITIKYLMSYRMRPLHLFGSAGLIFTSLGFIAGIYLVIIWAMGQGIGNRPLLILAVLLIVLGIQFVSLGLLGEMIANTAEKQNKSYSIKKYLK